MKSVFVFVVILSALANLTFCQVLSRGQIFSTNTNVTAKTQGAAARDCKAWKELGLDHSGIYPVKPDFGSIFQVYCDMESDGGGWTIFQRRMDGSVDFYRTWSDYQNGFGDLAGEYWLGLDKINRLTNTNARESHELRIELSDFFNTRRYAQYSSFSVGNAESKYTLSVGGYSGDAGDSLFPEHNGKKFTTKDQDNDNHNGHNCGVLFTGGWWYNKCHHSNLNGQYLVDSTDHKGIQWWKTWKHDTLKFTEMKCRQK